MLDKPAGVISTTDDPQGRACLARWLDELPAACFPVGRLDRETTGLLLLTDDGDLAYLLLQPDFHVPREYHLRVRGRVGPRDARLESLREGVDIGDGQHPARAHEVRPVAGGGEWTALRLVLREGRHRQVRRMCRRVGLYLEHLHRARLGPVRLGPMAPGQVRALEAPQRQALWRACGGRGLPRRRAIAAMARRAQRWREQGRPEPRLEAWLEAWRAQGP